MLSLFDQRSVVVRFLHRALTRLVSHQRAAPSSADAPASFTLLMSKTDLLSKSRLALLWSCWTSSSATQMQMSSGPDHLQIKHLSRVTAECWLNSSLLPTVLLCLSWPNISSLPVGEDEICNPVCWRCEKQQPQRFCAHLWGCGRPEEASGHEFWWMGVLQTPLPGTACTPAAAA